jgi:O-antigen/teichoic acid export membrane protein
VLTTAIVTVMVGVLILTATAIALRGSIAELLFGTSEEAALVVWMAALLVAMQIGAFAREVLRLHFWADAYLVSSALTAVFGGVVSVVGVALVDGGPTAMLAGGVVGATVGAAYGMIRAHGSYVGRFSQDELRRMLNYGLPLIPTALAVWALTFIDRLLLEHFGSLSQVGEYAMANRLASIVLLVVTAFGVAFSPFALDLRTRDPDRERVVRAQALTAPVTALALIGAALSAFAREVLALLAPAFEGAADTVGLLCLGTLRYGVASVVMLEISIARRTYVFAVYSVIGALVNVVLNVALIPSIGTVAAGVATVAAFLILAVGYWWHAQRIAWTAYEMRLVLTLILAASVVGALGFLPLGPLYAFVKVVGVAGFVAYLWVRGLLPLNLLRPGAWVSPT